MMSKDLRDGDVLSRRISADLKERAQSTGMTEDNFSEKIDEVPETKKTGKFAWVWLVLTVMAVISLILIIMI